MLSASAKRLWIEIMDMCQEGYENEGQLLRRGCGLKLQLHNENLPQDGSASAKRLWIEIPKLSRSDIQDIVSFCEEAVD